MQNQINSAIFSAMQTGKPYKSYKKTILGQAFVNVLNPFFNQPEGRILRGNPNTNDPDCIVDIWSEQEDVFFKRMNRKSLSEGVLVEFARAEAQEPTEEELMNSMSDEELEKLLASKFFTLSNALSKFTSEAPVYRLLSMAERMEKSEKILDIIRARLAEIQGTPIEEK